MERIDDFEHRRKHLKDLSEGELEKRFWDLLGQVVDPLVELARTHTTPSVERSVLLRMGFSSLEADSIVKNVIDHNLIAKGAGHVVYRIAREENLDIRTAGQRLGAGELWDKAGDVFFKAKTNSDKG